MRRLANNVRTSNSCIFSGFRGRPNTAREMKSTQSRPSTAPMAGRMIAPAMAPMPKIEPIQYICADVAAAPLKAPMAVPVEADPKAEINMSMPPILAAPVILPVAICATRRARRVRRPDTWVIAAMMPFRSRSMCRRCFFVFTQLAFSIEETGSTI